MIPIDEATTEQCVAALAKLDQGQVPKYPMLLEFCLCPAHPGPQHECICHGLGYVPNVSLEALFDALHTGGWHFRIQQTRTHPPFASLWKSFRDGTAGSAEGFEPMPVLISRALCKAEGLREIEA